MMKNYITFKKESLRFKVSFILMTFLMTFGSFQAQAQEDDYSEVNITVTDTQAPTVVAPSDISIDGCDRNDISNTYPLWGYSTTPVSLSLTEYEGLSGASATDNGSIASITYTDSTDNGSCTEVVTRTFTITDNCDNSTNAIQVITVSDGTAPTLTCLNDQDVIISQTESEYIVSGSEFDVTSITDNCSSSFTVTNSLNGSSTLDGVSLPLGVNSVTWTVEDECGNISTCTFELNVIAPDIVATLTAIDIDGNPMPVLYESVGQGITYEISFENNGTYGINVITVTDPNADPGSITYLSGDTDGDNTLDPNETWVYTETRTVTQQNIDDGQVANTATVHGYIDENSNGVFDYTDANGNGSFDLGEEDEQPTSNDTQEVIVEALQNPQMAFTKTQTSVNYNSSEADGNSVSPVKQLGDVINYDIVIENTGNITITNVNLTDSFPGSGTGNLSSKTETGGTGSNGDDILDVGETWTYTASYTVTQADIDGNVPLVNTAELVTSQIAGPTYATENTPVDGSIILSLEKTQVSITNPDSSPAGTFVDEPADRITYSITLSNDGSRTLTNVSPTETFPGSGIGTLSSATESMNADGTLEVGEVWTYTATYSVNQADIDNNSVLTNTISVIADELSTPEVATATTSVSRNPAWTVSKVQTPAGQTYTNTGDILTYGISLDNTGNISISNIKVTDLTADSTPGVVRQADIVGNNDNIMDPGESWYYTAQYTVTQADIDSGSYTNKVSATGDPVGGGVFSGVEDQETIEASQTLSIDDVVVTEGENVDFLISLTGISATDITFTPQFSNGTATIGTDTGTPVQYSSNGGSSWTNYSSGQITIPSGITSLLVRIPTVDDVLTEPQENFTFTAIVTSGNTANTNIPATATINDNDAISISLSGFEITETEATQAGYFVARIDGGALAQEDIVLSFSTADGTALDSQDYSAQSNSNYTISSGTSLVSIPVDVLGDAISEPTEDFTGEISITNTNGQNVSLNTATATSTINDNDTASIAINDVSINEADGTAVFTVTLTGNIQDQLTADFTTADNSAVNPDDYTTNSGTITFAAGATSGATQTISVNIIEDAIAEPTETFFVNLSNLVFSGAASISDNQGVGTINDNDTASIVINDVSVNEADGTAVFTVTLTGYIQDQLTADFATADNSAVNPDDYTTTSGTITFVAGSVDGATQTISVDIIEDAIAEPTETFFVNLSNLVFSGAASISDNQGVGTINDNDAISISLAGFTITETDATQQGNFVASIDGGATAQEDIVLSFTTTDGSAGASDYTAQSAVSYTITKGTSSVSIPVDVLGDAISEPTEDFTGEISITNANGQDVSLNTATA
ncbi:beta strand repeat-containing protein, partial [Christiangramia aestuarii]